MRRRNPPIPENIIKRYRGAAGLAKDAGTSENERRNARAIMAQLAEKYPGIETAAAAPVRPTAAPGPARATQPPPVPPEWSVPKREAAEAAARRAFWARTLPGLQMAVATAFVGLRNDGRVDLFLKDTYQASFASPDAAAYLIYEHIKSQPDERQRVAEVHFIILGSQGAQKWLMMALPSFAKRIGFRYVPGAPPHLPDEDPESGAGPGDFD